jgi:ribonuclease BN (tRNA processing enzyme)
VLIMHLAIGAGVTNPFHAAPAVVGRIAQEAGVDRLIVSHLGGQPLDQSKFDLDAAIGELKQSYTGPLTIGADLQCTSPPTDPNVRDSRIRFLTRELR